MILLTVLALVLVQLIIGGKDFGRLKNGKSQL